MVSLEVGLNAIVRSDFVASDGVGGRLSLRESQAAMSVEIVADGVPVIALNMNKIGHLSAIREDSGLRRVCDYLLVATVDGAYHAVLVELKKTWRSGDSSTEQLRRTLPIVKYLVSVVEVEYERDITALSISYASIFERMSDRFDKRHLKAPRQGLIDVEEWKGIRVKKFLGARLRIEDLATT